MTSQQINSIRAEGNTKFHVERTQENYDREFSPLRSDRFITYESGSSDRNNLFLVRPTSIDNPFVDINHGSSSFQVAQVSHTPSNQLEISIPNDFNKGYENKGNTVNSQFVLAVSQAPLLIRKLFIARTERVLCDAIRSLIKRSTNDSQYKTVMEWFNLFMETKNVEYLITIYTLQTPLYEVLQKENNAFTTLLYLYSKKLVDRAFGKGVTFRGMGKTDFNQYQAVISDYRWAMQNDDYVLETRLFQSTSKSRTVADKFMKPPENSTQPFFSVLFHFNFPEKCYTAFDIHEISNFPDEEEVLLFPFTLFKVTNIESISSDHHIISLTNVPIPRISLIKAWRNMKKK